MVDHYQHLGKLSIIGINMLMLMVVNPVKCQLKQASRKVLFYVHFSLLIYTISTIFLNQPLCSKQTCYQHEKKKTCSMVFRTKHNFSHSFKLIINFHDGASLKLCNVFKYLRPWLEPELTFKPHIDYICKIIYGLLSSLYRSINCFSFQVRKRISSNPSNSK